MAEYDYVEVAATTVLTRHGSCAHTDLGPTIGRLMGEAIQQNSESELVAPPMVVYLAWRETDCDIEVALPVDASTIAGPGNELKTYPACTAIHGTHNGAYEGLPDAWMGIWKYVVDNNVQVGEFIWDSYAVGPESDPNPANWVTDIYIALA